MKQNNQFDEKAREWDRRPGRREMAHAFVKEIKKSIPLSKEMDLLEFGCGTALVSMELQAAARSVMLVDTSEGMLAVAKQRIEQGRIGNVEPFCGDISSLTEQSKRFDLIYTLMTLHHVPDVAGLLDSFTVLLKPGGRLCIGDLEPEDGSFHGGAEDVHHGFDTTELKRLVEGKQFQVTHCHTMHTLHRTDEEGNRRAYPLFFLAARKVNRSEAGAKHD